MSAAKKRKVAEEDDGAVAMAASQPLQLKHLPPEIISIVLQFLPFKDQANLRVAWKWMNQIVLDEPKGFKTKGIMIADFSKPVDYLQTFQTLDLDIKVQVSTDSIKSEEEMINFTEIFKDRITEFEFSNQISPKLTKLNKLKVSKMSMNIAHISTLINNNSGSLQSLTLQSFTGEGLNITAPLSNLTKLTLIQCSASVMNQIVAVGRPSQLTHLQITSNIFYNIRAANVSTLINTNSGSLQSLTLESISREGLNITAPLPNLTKLALIQCSSSLMNKIVTVVRPSKLTNLQLTSDIISAANVSTLINNNSGSLQSLILQSIKGEGHSITRELPNLTELTLINCSTSLMNQIVVRPSQLTHLKVHSIIISAANVSTLINNNSGSLQSLILRSIKREGHSITRELPNLKLLQLTACSSDIETQIRGRAPNLNVLTSDQIDGF